MSKFSSAQARPNVTAPVQTTDRRTSTHEGGFGYARDPKSDLFLLAASNMVRENSFYESASERDDRFEQLIHGVTVSDPEWIQGFIPYLRTTMQMRTASVVMAAEYVKAGGPNARQVVASALQRADEPAELLAYWFQTYGKRVPQPVKRGVSDACQQLYTESAALKYDGQGKAWRMGDVVEICHAKPRALWQSSLYKWLIDRRHGREDIPEDLLMVAETMRLDAVPVPERRAMLSEVSTMTWERLSGWLQSAMEAEAWESVIPRMGYMALLRNLRNFEQAGVSAATLDTVARRLADPDEVARSRQFPIRFYSAFKSIPSERFAWVLEQALDASLVNIPRLPGRTLIMIDVSGSMHDSMSARSILGRHEVAALFGVALAKRCERADCWAYDAQPYEIAFKGASVLRLVNDLSRMVGGATYTFSILAQLYQAHDRVVILTDEQAHDDDSRIKHVTCPVYTFNLAGYAPAQTWSGARSRYSFGGLTDAGFQLIQALEDTHDGRWPWEQAA